MQDQRWATKIQFTPRPDHGQVTSTESRSVHCAETRSPNLPTSAHDPSGRHVAAVHQDTSGKLSAVEAPRQAGYHDTPPLVGGHPREAVRTRRHLTRHLREAVSCQGVTPGWEHEEACYNQGHVVMRSRTPRRARSQPRHISGTRTPMCTGTGWGSTLPGHGHTQRTRDLCDDWVLIPVLLDGWHQSRTLTLQVPHYTYTCQHRQDCSHILDFYLWVTIVTSWKLFYPIN